MILVRNIFQIHPGQMKEALALVREGRALVEQIGYPAPRMLTDVTGEFYTLVMETQFETLADFEEKLPKNFAEPQWQAWYLQFSQLIRSGRREIFRIVD